MIRNSNHATAYEKVKRISEIWCNTIVKYKDDLSESGAHVPIARGIIDYDSFTCINILKDAIEMIYNGGGDS